MYCHILSEQIEGARTIVRFNKQHITETSTFQSPRTSRNRHKHASDSERHTFSQGIKRLI